MLTHPMNTRLAIIVAAALAVPACADPGFFVPPAQRQEDRSQVAQPRDAALDCAMVVRFDVARPEAPTVSLPSSRGCYGSAQSITNNLSSAAAYAGLSEANAPQSGTCIVNIAWTPPTLLTPQVVYSGTCPNAAVSVAMRWAAVVANCHVAVSGFPCP